MAHDPEGRPSYSRTAAPDPLGPSEFGTEGDVPLETLLAEPLLRGTTIAGAPGLRHRVSWCLPLSEVEATGGAPSPDLAGVAVHVPATSLVADDSPDMIRRLAGRGAAALLAWPAPECPADLDLSRAAAAAEEAGLPLLRLRCSADYRAVSRLIGQKALAQSSHVLEYGVKVHRVLAEVLARGSGIPAMAAAIAGLAHCPVIVLDDEDEVIAHAFPGGHAPAGPEHLGELVTRAAGPVRGEVRRADAAGPVRGEVRRADATGPVRGEVRRGGDEPRDRGRAAEGGETLRPGETTEHVLDLDGRPLHATLAAIVVGGELYGRLALIQNEWPPDTHDLAQHRVIAEHGGTLTGSEMLRQRSVQAAEERARGDFIEALVHGRFADAHELQARARHHGFAVEGRYGVHVVSAHALLPSSRHDLQRVAAMTRIAQGVESHPELCTLATTVGALLVVIRQLPGDASAYVDARAEGGAILHFSRQLHRALRGHLGDDLRVTHGRPGHGAAGVATGYYEARVAMGLAKHTGADAVCGYDDLRVFAAIKDVAAGAEGRAFAHEMLSALRGVQSQSGDLERVVITYIKSAGNLNAAARELKLHRNTMLYKLDRASRALRMDVRSADTQFMVWLAHHIDTLASITAQLEDELALPAAEAV